MKFRYHLLMLLTAMFVTAGCQTVRPVALDQITVSTPGMPAQVIAPGKPVIRSLDAQFDKTHQDEGLWSQGWTPEHTGWAVVLVAFVLVLSIWMKERMRSGTPKTTQRRSRDV